MKTNETLKTNETELEYLINIMKDFHKLAPVISYFCLGCMEVSAIFGGIYTSIFQTEQELWAGIVIAFAIATFSSVLFYAISDKIIKVYNKKNSINTLNEE